eukprot:scaffold6310_cov67-Phaeocystis_antarctica.AAC.10
MAGCLHIYRRGLVHAASAHKSTPVSHVTKHRNSAAHERRLRPIAICAESLTLLKTTRRGASHISIARLRILNHRLEHFAELERRRRRSCAAVCGAHA